ncbi:MAG: flagellar biosynthesis protein FlhB [Burkholderiales bacterium]|nr:flagellar biosynthesis protein FlhB [Burkholderiales bacterium]MCH2242788.1 flagellar biosynthesis protein FlhB [Aquabacterium sp.]
MADDTTDRNLPATGRRLEKAREQGQVPRSRDLGHFAVMLGAVGALAALAPMLAGRLQELLATGLRFDARTVAQPEMMLERLATFGGVMLLAVVPLALAVGLMSAAASILSGGWNWTWQPLMPNFGKLNPVSGLGRLFSKDQLIETLKTSALALLLGAIGAMFLARNWPDFVAALAQPLPTGIGQIASLLATAFKYLLLTLAVFALIDWPLQRFLHAKRLRMSREEVKQEHKDQEGNQEVKGKMKQIARQRARKRMLANVPKADLVVMNPTHYAVALKYDEGSMGAPRVIAKGADRLAMRIRDLARDHEVPVLQAPPLARALYAHTELDQEIPMALYSAVAQVLAYVYQLKAALAGRAPMPQAMPDIVVPAELDPHNKPGRRPAH